MSVDLEIWGKDGRQGAGDVWMSTNYLMIELLIGGGLSFEISIGNRGQMSNANLFLRGNKEVHLQEISILV